MSTTFTIEQAKGMVGTVIPRLEAKLTKIYDRTTGEGQYGPYSFQNGEVEDSTGAMKVVFANMPDVSELVGSTRIFKSMPTKHGLKGVEVKENDYKGKKTLELKIHKTALNLTKEEEDHVEHAAPANNIPENTNPQPSRPLVESKQEDLKLGVALARNRMTQLAGLYDLCWKTVEGMDVGKLLENHLDLRKDIATTLFIQGVKDHLADKMPVRTASKFYNEEAITPSSASHRGEPAAFDGPPSEEPPGDLKDSDIPF